MFLRYRYLLSSVFFWPVLPIVLIALYDMSGLHNAPFWQSLLMYAVCIIPAIIMLLKHRRLFKKQNTGIIYKLLIACYSLTVMLSVGWILFMSAAPPGWD